MKEALKVLSELVTDGVIEAYAIGGAMGALEEALAHAVSFDYDGVGARVLPAEYLAAIAVQTGRVKDKLRVQSFLASNKFDKKVFADICMAHGLSCPVGEDAK